MNRFSRLPDPGVGAAPRRGRPLTSKLADMVQWIPRDNKEWLVARDKWKSAILASTLSPATKVVAVVIADFYINRNPSNRLFNWAWAAQGTLADAAGLSRRTIASAMDELERNQLIVVDRGGGKKGHGGRTHRYTLRLDHLTDLWRRPVEDENAQNLHNPASKDSDASCANSDLELRNPRPKDVQGLPTTPSNIYLGDSLYRSPKEGDIGGSKEGALPIPQKRVSKRKGLPVAPIRSFPQTGVEASIAQADLAEFVGGGDIRFGWELLMALPEGEADRMALRFKQGECTRPGILEEIRKFVEAAEIRGGL